MFDAKIAHERELVSQQFAAKDNALRLQAAEYERRLGAHDQALVAQAKTVPRGEYAIHLDTSQRAGKDTMRAIADLNARVDGLQSRWAAVVVILTLLFSALGVVARFR